MQVSSLRIPTRAEFSIPCQLFTVELMKDVAKVFYFTIQLIKPVSGNLFFLGYTK